MKKLLSYLSAFLGSISLSSATPPVNKASVGNGGLKPFEVSHINNTWLKAKVGSILFFEQPITNEVVKETNAITTYEVNSDRNLYFKLVTKNSLVNYGIEIYPNSNLGRLQAHLRYRFKFYIDASFVYQTESREQLIPENLMNTATCLDGSFVSADGGANWAKDVWSNFLKNNTSKLNVGKHQLKIEVLPYITYSTDEFVGQVVASGEITLLVKQSVFNAKTMCPQPKMTDAALEKEILAAYIDKGKDGIPLKAVISDMDWTHISTNTGVPHHRDIHAVLLFKKDGKCVTKKGAFFQEFTGTGYGKTKMYNVMEGYDIPIECLK